MKKVLSLVLMMGLFSAPVCSAAASADQLVQMVKGNTTLDSLCVAVYETVKADTTKAVDVFKAVMGAKDSWTATETYAVLRSVMLASPSLEQGFIEGAKAGGNVGGSYTPSVISAPGYQLFSLLCTMPQTQAVASVVTQGVAGSSVTGGQAAGSGVTTETYVPTVPAVPTPPDEEYPVIPTPPPTSADN